jgi:hypothetical protein
VNKKKQKNFNFFVLGCEGVAIPGFIIGNLKADRNGIWLTCFVGTLVSALGSVNGR